MRAACCLQRLFSESPSERGPPAIYANNPLNPRNGSTPRSTVGVWEAPPPQKSHLGPYFWQDWALKIPPFLRCRKPGSAPQAAEESSRLPPGEQTNRSIGLQTSPDARFGNENPNHDTRLAPVRLQERPHGIPNGDAMGLI